MDVMGKRPPDGTNAAVVASLLRELKTVATQDYRDGGESALPLLTAMAANARAAAKTAPDVEGAQLFTKLAEDGESQIAQITKRLAVLGQLSDVHAQAQSMIERIKGARTQLEHGIGPIGGHGVEAQCDADGVVTLLNIHSDKVTATDADLSEAITSTMQAAYDIIAAAVTDATDRIYNATGTNGQRHPEAGEKTPARGGASKRAGGQTISAEYPGGTTIVVTVDANARPVSCAIKRSRDEKWDAATLSECVRNTARLAQLHAMRNLFHEANMAIACNADGSPNPDWWMGPTAADLEDCEAALTGTPAT